MSASQLFADWALLPEGWARDVLLAWDDQGRLTTVQAGAAASAAASAGMPRAAGPVLPGMPNLHSHAFQRGFAGLTEYRSRPHGDNPAGADAEVNPQTLDHATGVSSNGRWIGLFFAAFLEGNTAARGALRSAGMLDPNVTITLAE